MRRFRSSAKWRGPGCVCLRMEAAVHPRSLTRVGVCTGVCLRSQATTSSYVVQFVFASIRPPPCHKATLPSTFNGVNNVRVRTCGPNGGTDNIRFDCPLTRAGRRSYGLCGG
eukprot:GHVU01196093.1.p1 GENE.GHVU01196093.1~~GHVU01196093.1.p1  ORF type:complete len:112 (-),score=5.43 GHVU01196093.1:851-1186(-)